MKIIKLGHEIVIREACVIFDDAIRSGRGDLWPKPLVMRRSYFWKDFLLPFWPIFVCVCIYRCVVAVGAERNCLLFISFGRPFLCTYLLVSPVLSLDLLLIFIYLWGFYQRFNYDLNIEDSSVFILNSILYPELWNHVSSFLERASPPGKFWSTTHFRKARVDLIISSLSFPFFWGIVIIILYALFYFN